MDPKAGFCHRDTLWKSGKHITIINLLHTGFFSRIPAMQFLLSSSIPYGVVRAGLGLIFIYSGLSKFMDLALFVGIINAFAIIPQGLTHGAAAGIVGAELVLGTGLVLDRRGSLAGVLVLLLGFMAVAGYAIAMGYDIDCGCFGPTDPEAVAFSGLHTVLYRDSLMVAAAGYLYLWRYKNRWRPSPLFVNKI